MILIRRVLHLFPSVDHMSNRRSQVMAELPPVAEAPVVPAVRLSLMVVIIAINIIVSVIIGSAQFADWAT
jgi:hypothetical protein